MSIGWTVFGLIVAIGLVAVFGFTLFKTVRDAQRAYYSDRWDHSDFLDLATNTSASGRQRQVLEGFIRVAGGEPRARTRVDAADRLRSGSMST